MLGDIYNNKQFGVNYENSMDKKVFNSLAQRNLELMDVYFKHNSVENRQESYRKISNMAKLITKKKLTSLSSDSYFFKRGGIL